MNARAVLITAGYVLIAESVIAALLSLGVTGPLDAAFANAGGLLAAAQAPGAPWLIEGALPLVFGSPRVWLAALACVAAWALLAPLLQLVWLAGLRSGASDLPAAAARGVARLGAALRLRLLLLVPAALGVGTIVIAVVYAQLVFRAASDRASDLAALAALTLGLLGLSPLRVVSDLGHAALVLEAPAAGEALALDARQRTSGPGVLGASAALATALRALSFGLYVRWALATCLGVVALVTASALTGVLRDAVAVVVVVLAGFLRYALRSAWLAAALGSLPRLRLGSVTQKLAPPAPSSASSAEMLPP